MIAYDVLEKLCGFKEIQDRIEFCPNPPGKHLTSSTPDQSKKKSQNPSLLATM
jgi:hypothetical protein